MLESLLAAAFGAPIRVETATRLAPWFVMRCTLAQPANGAAPKSVIVKWLRDDPSGFRNAPEQVATELAALEFLAELDFPCAPRVIAADHRAGVLVIEDVAPRTSLAEQLRQKPCDVLVDERLAFARAMGDLNAATAGKASLYEARRGRFGAFDLFAGCKYGVGPTWPRVQRELSGLGLPMASGAENDLARLLETLERPGPFLALSNGDPEANNFLVMGADGRLIDFEFAGYRHALTCATWMHVPGPAWVTVSDPMCGELEDEYRRALSQTTTEASDDHLFGLAMASACLALALDRLRRFETLDQRPVGDRSRAQLVSTLESATRAARRHRALAHLASWTERAAAWLRKRWPDADADFAQYGAYSPRG